MTVEEKEFCRLALSIPPEASVLESFQDGDGMELIREFTSAKMRVPTREQLQQFARGHGKPLKYSEVAPLLRNFRKILLDAFAGVPVVAHSSTQAQFAGKLIVW